MKQISYLFFLVFLTSLMATSCSDTKTYAELLKDEKNLIEAYIKRSNIEVVSAFPASTAWTNDGKDVYVLTTSGLYFHMVNAGDLSSNDTLMSKNIVVPRYKEYTLGVVADTISNWSTIDYTYPSSFTYGDLTLSCKAFHEAASYMKRNDTEAKIIVPSSIGFNADLLTVTPKAFDIKIKFMR
jgi:hypothetical protein